MKIVKAESSWLDKTDLSIEEVIELCGRVCYKSEEKITKESNKSFINGIIKSGHESVLEHSAIGVSVKINDDFLENILKNIFLTFDLKVIEYGNINTNSHIFAIMGNIRRWRNFLQNFRLYDFEYISANFLKLLANYSPALFGDLYKPCYIDELNLEIIPQEEVNQYYKTAHIICDRATSHQLVRHRIMSYSQESMRYCNYSKDKFDNEIQFIKPADLEIGTGAYNLWQQSCKHSEDCYFQIIKYCKPEVSRAVLPQCTKTELYMSGFVNDWVKVFELRCDSHAQRDIRELMENLQKDL